MHGYFKNKQGAAQPALFNLEPSNLDRGIAPFAVGRNNITEDASGNMYLNLASYTFTQIYNDGNFSSGRRYVYMADITDISQTLPAYFKGWQAGNSKISNNEYMLTYAPQENLTSAWSVKMGLKVIRMTNAQVTRPANCTTRAQIFETLQGYNDLYKTAKAATDNFNIPLFTLDLGITPSPISTGGAHVNYKQNRHYLGFGTSGGGTEWNNYNVGGIMHFKPAWSTKDGYNYTTGGIVTGHPGSYMTHNFKIQQQTGNRSDFRNQNQLPIFYCPLSLGTILGGSVNYSQDWDGLVIPASANLKIKYDDAFKTASGSRCAGWVPYVKKNTYAYFGDGMGELDFAASDSYEVEGVTINCKEPYAQMLHDGNYVYIVIYYLMNTTTKITISAGNTAVMLPTCRMEAFSYE